MFMLVIVVIGVVFLFGLVQWARSGAVLWDIREALHLRQSLSLPTDEISHSEAQKQKTVMRQSIQKMESSMDNLLRSSIKVIGAVAVCVWLFVAATFVMDALGFVWTDRFTGYSSHRLMAFTGGRTGGTSSMGTAARGGNSGGGARNDALRGLGAQFRR